MAQPHIKLYWLNDSRAQRIAWLLEELHLDYDIDVFRRGADMRAPPELLQVHPLGKSPVVSITLPGLAAAAAAAAAGESAGAATATAAGAGSGPREIVLAESGFIAQYLVDHFSQGNAAATAAGDDGDSARPSRPLLAPRRYRDGYEGVPGAESDEWLRYQYFLHYAEGSLMPPLLVALILGILKSPRIPFIIRPITSGVSDKLAAAFVAPEMARHLAFLENQLETAPGVEESSGGGYLCGPRLTAADILMIYPLQMARQRAGGLGYGKEGKKIADQFSRVWEYLRRLENEPGYKRAEEKIRRVVENQSK